jgi:hypothetical protein
MCVAEDAMTINITAQLMLKEMWKVDANCQNFTSPQIFMYSMSHCFFTIWSISLCNKDIKFFLNLPVNLKVKG